MAQSGLATAGIQVARAFGASGFFCDDPTFPVLNVSHTAPAGQIQLSAGSNSSSAFYVQPQVGGSQLFTGPNATISNVFQAPGTALLGTANVSNGLNVMGPSSLSGNVQITGPTVISGSLLTTGSTTVGNVLTVGNTVNAPTFHANTITTSAFTATGALANAYVETSSNLASTTAALYLSPTWRIKSLATGALGFQSLLAGQWTNASVIAPAGLGLTIGQLTSSST